MGTRSTAVLASGSASAAKLLVAALAFTAAYVGVSAYDTANSAPAPQSRTTTTIRFAAVTTDVAPEAGSVVVNPLTTSGGCERAFRARGVVVSPTPGDTVLYGWRLARWSAPAHDWKTYLVDHEGFYGPRRTVSWEPRVIGNPGWYRVELSVEGGRTIRSEKFRVSC